MVRPVRDMRFADMPRYFMAMNVISGATISVLLMMRQERISPIRRNRTSVLRINALVMTPTMVAMAPSTMNDRS